MSNGDTVFINRNQRKALLTWVSVYLTHRLILKVKLLASDEYDIVALMDGPDCPVEFFLLTGEAGTHAHRVALVQMLRTVAEKGLQNVPAAWMHEANKQDRIYEFIKGPLRLFFFKGHGRQIAVCCGGVRKKGPKADKAEVAKAAKARKEYLRAVADNALEVIEDED